MKYTIQVLDRYLTYGGFMDGAYPVRVKVERMEKMTTTIAHVSTKDEAKALIAGLEARDGEPAEITYDEAAEPEPPKKAIRRWWP